MVSFRDYVYWGRTKIAFEYQFGPRKTLAISVHPDLRVTVKAPEGTLPAIIRERVKKRDLTCMLIRNATYLFP